MAVSEFRISAVVYAMCLHLPSHKCGYTCTCTIDQYTLYKKNILIIFKLRITKKDRKYQLLCVKHTHRQTHTLTHVTTDTNMHPYMHARNRCEHIHTYTVSKHSKLNSFYLFPWTDRKLQHAKKECMFKLEFTVHSLSFKNNFQTPHHTLTLIAQKNLRKFFK